MTTKGDDTQERGGDRDRNEVDQIRVWVLPRTRMVIDGDGLGRGQDDQGGRRPGTRTVGDN